jgi:hypothetical protein
MQSANAGPGLLLHEAVSASPFFEMDTVPLGQVKKRRFRPSTVVVLAVFLPDHMQAC